MAIGTDRLDGRSLQIRPLVEPDVEEADRIARIAFGTFMGLSRPDRFFGDADWIGTRWRSTSSAALVADVDGAVVGSSFATNWGSVGFLGPLTVHPDFWGRSVATSLLGATMDVFARSRTEHVGLFTFGDSPKHVGLYQRFGFWPRFLTAVMRARIDARPTPSG
ncbi:MAG: GNAT family N-acetyltransferase, partial [Actinomycetota bacterium]|nr:GNAT family N-acetyltransferase [Actinomycetota bacterium]